MERNPNCELCGLCESTKTVCIWGDGPPKAKITIIGEAPGSTGSKTGKPFQGQAGQLLRTSLEKVGINPDECYITNMVKCRPPDNRSPSSKELKACRPYLEQELKDVSPEFVLLLGATALKLIKKTGITELRGSVFHIDGKYYFPCFHPAAILRDPGKQVGFEADLAKFTKLVSGTLETDKETEFRFISPETENEFFGELNNANALSFDIETTGLQQHGETFRVNSIGITFDSDSTWVLSINIDEKTRVDSLVERAKWARKIIRKTQRISKEKKIVVIGHNGKFDNMGLMSEVGERFFLNFDTMLASHIFDENIPHDLKYLAKVLCGAPDYDDLTVKQKIDPVGQNCLDRFYQYQANDSYWTMQLYKYYNKKFKSTFKLRRLFYKLVMPAARVFEEVDYGGLFINLENFEKTRIDLKEKIKKNEEELHKLYGGKRRVNWGSPTQVAQVLFDKLKLPVIEKTPTGKPGTGESVLLQLKGMHPIPDKLIEWRGNNKLLNTYIEGWEELMVGPYLYLSTKLHGTVTGRYSSRLHQVPRDGTIRNLISAPPGWTFICADFSQIELRLAADASQDPTLIKIFNEGGDVHTETAKWVMMADNPTKEQRKSAKAVNFGFIYGMGAPKFKRYAKEKYDTEFTDSGARQAREIYFGKYFGLTPWHDRMRRTVRDQGYVEYLSGRLRRLPGVFSSDSEVRAEAERQAINSPIQGFGSGDLKVMALLAVYEHFPKENLQIKGEVHDSGLMLVRNEFVEEYLPQIKKIMENPPLLKEFKIKLSVPLVVDIEYGPCWGQGETFKG